MKKINILKQSIRLLPILVIYLGVLLNTAFAQTDVPFYSTSTWTVPAGVHSITIQCWGAGGAGGTAIDPAAGLIATGGGGGGAYATNTISVTPGDVLDITIGAGGTASSTGVVVDGGNTIVSFNSTVLCKAVGGKSVTGTQNCTGALGGNYADCFPVTGAHSGGNGGNGEGDVCQHSGAVSGAGSSSGGGGGAAGPAANGSNGSNGVQSYWKSLRHHEGTKGLGGKGAVGNPGSGNGGDGFHSTVFDFASNGKNGSNYGGGGGGSVATYILNRPGGSGAPGAVIISYSITCDGTPGTINGTQWVCSTTDTVYTFINTISGSSTNSGSYSWEFATSNEGPWEVISGANNEFYSASETGWYRRGYTPEGCPTSYTSALSATKPNPSDAGYVTFEGSQANTSTNVCYGNPVEVELSTTLPSDIASTLIVWQTSTTNTEDDWTNVATGHTYTYTSSSVTETVYIRYLRVIGACRLPSNNTFSIAPWSAPIITSISAPTDLCPGSTSYNVTANITLGSSNTISTYNWTGATGTSNIAAVSATIPNCGETYNYSLQVTDGNGCISTAKEGSFTTSTPSHTIGTLPTVNAELTGTCSFEAPNSLEDVLNANLITTCGNKITNFDYSESSLEVEAGGTELFHISSITDMCGTHTVNIPVYVTAPAGPTVQISAVDTFLCPGTTTTLSAITTQSSELSYDWTPGHSTNSTLETTAITNQVAVVTESEYSLTVTDENGCSATDNITIVTTPKAYINDYTFAPQCTPYKFIFRPQNISSNIVLNDQTVGQYHYNTLYTWTHTPVEGVRVTADCTTPVYPFTTGGNPLINSSLSIKTVEYTVTPHTTTSKDGEEVSTCVGDDFKVNVIIKPSVANNGGITNFDDRDVVITLWYGLCDTLYEIATPTYNNNFVDASFRDNIVLTNDKGGSVNSGTLLGRIAPGEYTIRWTLTDECGNHVDFDKKYIVIYPNCGDADPNFSQSFTAKDADNNLYHTVRIGCECWLASNLKTYTGAHDSKIYTSPEFPNAFQNKEKFGRLYSWYTANQVPEGDDNAMPTVITEPLSQLQYVQGICPDGWALPKMSDYSNMVSVAGGVDPVKSDDQTTWLPGAAGTNASGFNAKGAGFYDNSIDRYLNILGETNFWSCENITMYKGKCGVIAFNCPEFMEKEVLKGMGFSVRCIRRAN